jgi:hypothetical protein
LHWQQDKFSGCTLCHSADIAHSSSAIEFGDKDNGFGAFGHSLHFTRSTEGNIVIALARKYQINQFASVHEKFAYFL